MCLLRRAAEAWQSLVETEYEIIAGRKGKTYIIKLEFDCADFPHLAGMQYARDVDFGLNESEYYGEKLVKVLLNGKLDGCKIEKSRRWPKIRGRLKAIINLQNTLDTEFELANFDPGKVRTGSKIDAEYVIKNLDSGETYFVFVDEDDAHRQYCKSAFAQENVDYMCNQARLVVLKVTKIEQGVEKTLFVHPNYIPRVENGGD